MIIKFLHKKIDEADEIQNGNGESNASQDVNVTNQPQEINIDTTEVDGEINKQLAKKGVLKSQYTNDLKTINDQITLLQKQKGDIETAEVTSDEQASSNRAKIININKQVIELVNRKLVRKTQYQNDVKTVEQTLVGLYKKKADDGGNVDVSCVEEKLKDDYRFSKKLYEAVLNRTEEMYAIISMSFDQIKDLSYRPETSRCRTFAKNIIGFLNKFESNDDEDKGSKLIDFVRNMLNSSHISLASNEKDEFMNNFTEALKKNAMFSWIFVKNN